MVFSLIWFHSKLKKGFKTSIDNPQIYTDSAHMQLLNSHTMVEYESSKC